MTIALSKTTFEPANDANQAKAEPHFSVQSQIIEDIKAKLARICCVPNIFPGTWIV